MTAAGGTVAPAAPAAARGALATWSGYPWVVLGASLLVQTAASFGNQSISPLGPFLLEDLRVSRGQLGLLLTAMYLGGSLVLTWAGRLGDRFGVRLPFLGGTLVAAAGLALASGAPDFGWLLLPLAVYGVGNGFALPPTTRAIVDWFPAHRRGLAMGIKQTGVALAGVLCGLTVPALAATFGWRGAYAALAAAVAAAGLAAWALYRERPVEHDVMTAPPRQPLSAVLRQRNLLLMCGVTWVFAAVQLSVTGFLVLFLRERLRVSVVEGGALLALAQAGGMAGRIGWGVVSDLLFRGHRKPVMAIVGLVAAASTIALALVDAGTPGWVLWAILLATGVSSLGWNGINMTFVAELGGRGASATAAGMNLTASYLGIMAGPPLFGWLVDVTGSYAVAFQASASLFTVALILLAQVRPAQVR